MGKLQTFALAFDNPIATYYAGQTVVGHVKVHLKESMQLRGIYLRFEGKAYVHWTERHTRKVHGRNQPKTVHRSATESYFDLKQCLWGKGVKETLAAGYYEFPFTMILPVTLPTSFEGSHGHVRYHCQANIDRPWKFDPKCKAAFTVLSVMDLNAIPDASRPVTRENHKDMGMCCFKSGGPLSVTVAVNKIGVVPGENLFINAAIENLSSKVMNKTSATLLTRIAYHAQFHMKAETKVVAQMERGPIAAYSNDEWVNVPLKIPALPPTGGCQLINVEYFLKFAVDPSGIGFDLEIDIPVIIGTIPLRVNFTHFHAAVVSPATAPSYTTSAPASSTTAFVPPSFEFQPPSAPMPIAGIEASAPPMYESLVKDKYPDLPPPSYEECVYGTVNIKEEEGDEHTSGQLDYTPRYAYYNLN